MYVFEREHIRQAYFYSCCFALWSRVLHTHTHHTPPRSILYSLCIQVTAWSLGLPVYKSTVLGWHLCTIVADMAHTSLPFLRGASWCVHMCLRMERPEVRVVPCWGLLSSSNFLHELEFLAELASHCFGWINRTTGVWNPPVSTPALMGYGHTAQHLALHMDLNSGYADVESNLPSELYLSWDPPFRQSACETQENMPLGN